MSLLAKARAIIAELPVAEVRLASFQHVCPVDIAENAARLEYEEGLTRDEADRRALGARGYSSWPALADTHPERICGQRVTWKSRREQPLQRLIRSANKIDDRLDAPEMLLEHFVTPSREVRRVLEVGTNTVTYVCARENGISVLGQEDVAIE
jgi:hypothetical protein